jgi:hypothetical protein
VARVLKIKLDELWNDLVNNEIFGAIKWGMYRVEYQKRGLPHAYILIAMENQYKPNSVEVVD